MKLNIFFCALVCVNAYAIDSSSDTHAMRTALLGVTLTELSNAIAGNVGDESSRWGDLAPMIRDNLGYQDNFEVKIGDVVEPMVSLKYKKILVPAALNDTVDHEGITPMVKYGIFQAFGLQERKNDSRRYITTRPRLARKGYKIMLGTLLGTSLVTTAAGAISFGIGLNSDPEESTAQIIGGQAALLVGMPLAYVLGGALLDACGVSIHLTKAGQVKEDSAFFAIERLSMQELKDVLTELNKKRFAVWQDNTVKSLLDVQIYKLERDAQTAS
jgi:hypothetical protein